VNITINGRTFTVTNESEVISFYLWLSSQEAA
jgi:hypothetical protein